MITIAFAGKMMHCQSYTLDYSGDISQESLSISHPCRYFSQSMIDCQ